MKRALLVDDDASMRVLLQMHLKRLDYKADMAADGASAIEWLEKGPYDLILLDLMMPDANGSELLRYLEENDMKIPCVVVSAASEATINLAKQSRVVCGALRKPFDPDQLRQVIEEATNTAG
jgi:CheY-like chemotaxis protein